MDYSENFITQEQIERVIELPFSEIDNMLIKYVYFKGLVYGRERVITYVDGYFIFKVSEIIIDDFTREELERDPYLAEMDRLVSDADRAPLKMLEEIKGTKFSNNDDLIGVGLSPKISSELDVVLYSYKQLCQLMKKLGCPDPKPLTELAKKEYAYDVELVNQKSNFTLSEAVRIAANSYDTSKRRNAQVMYTPITGALMDHYLELLSDCIKGTNQHGFKLHTVELWCSYNDEGGESYSNSYDNGTYLKQKATLDSKLTIISKREFVRWCEYENVDTGLTLENKDFEESIEALKAENEKLKAQQRPAQQIPPSMLNKNNNEKIERLNTEIKSLTEEVELLKGNSFSVMTTKLKAILATQNKYWISYDNMNLPTQQEISNFIAEKLNLTVTVKSTNRTADELAKAIQPDEIKRK
jgi:hypothetical protein